MISLFRKEVLTQAQCEEDALLIHTLGAEGYWLLMLLGIIIVLIAFGLSMS